VYERRASRVRAARLAASPVFSDDKFSTEFSTEFFIGDRRQTLAVKSARCDPLAAPLLRHPPRFPVVFHSPRRAASPAFRSGA